MGVLGAVDRTQRRHRVLGFPLAVLYKYFDDQGNYLSAAITYYAFVAIFPLLLLATSILGFVLQGNHELHAWADSTLTNFPIVGDQLGTPQGLQGSVPAVVFGGLIALYGAMGLGQAIQNAMHVVWSVPRNSRPNPIMLRLKSLLILSSAGLAVVTITTVSFLGRETEVFGHDLGATLGWVITVVEAALIALLLIFLLRIAAADDLSWKRAAPGGIFIATLWQLLQALSAAYIGRVAGSASSMSKTFGLVLGIIGITFIAANVGVLGMELNVVLARRLWPRALLTPFTDSVLLTRADRKAYTSYARAQRHKGFEEVTVSFDNPATDEEFGSTDGAEPASEPEPEQERG
jgi:membrane protein